MGETLGQPTALAVLGHAFVRYTGAGACDTCFVSYSVNVDPHRLVL